MTWIDAAPSEFAGILESALSVDLPYSDRYQRRPLENAMSRLTPAAVLLLFGFSSTDAGHLLYTLRTETVDTHKGQMAFPGGRCESGDLDGPIGTALRETEEEVGIPAEAIRVLGRLRNLITVTGFLIHPIVGLLNLPLEEVQLRTSSFEIAEALWVPLNALVRPGVYQKELISLESHQYPIDVYRFERYRIWGATGTMTRNMLDRLDFSDQSRSGAI